jgi:capsid protein
VKNQSGAPEGLTRRYETSTTGQTLEKVETGEIHYLRPNEALEEIGSSTPGGAFDPFVEKCLRLIGAALGLPYEFVLLDFSRGSFSSSRAALLQTYRTFQTWQQWLQQSLLQPVWNWRIAKAIKAGELRPAPVDSRGVSQWYRVQWQTPEFGWVDPQNEAQANILEITSGASSLTQWVRKKGGDAEEMLAEKGRDIANAARIAAEINAEHGTSITWHDLITLGIPGQVTKSQAEAGAPKDAKQDIEATYGKGAGVEQWLT